MKYHYRVRDARGVALKGILEADHKNAVIMGLLEQGFAIVHLREHDTDIPAHRQLHLSARVDRGALAAFTRQLSVMLAAGMPIMDCLQTVQLQNGDPALRRIFDKVIAEVRAGSGLGQALSAYPQTFSPVYINMIKAGEASGALDTMLLRLSDHLQKGEESRRKLKSASAYPVFTALLAVFIMGLLVVLVIPRFAGILESSGVSLPWSTRFLLYASEELVTAVPFLIGLIAGSICLIKRAARTSKGGVLLDTLKLRLPLIGPLERKRIMAAFTGTLGILLKAGIPILPALEVVGETITNWKYREVISAVRRSISAGATVAEPLARSGVFPPMLTDMIAVGEATGTLDIVLGQLSDFCDTELNDSVENMTKLIEPLLILVVAGIVGAVVVAMLLPMLDMVSTVSM